MSLQGDNWELCSMSSWALSWRGPQPGRLVKFPSVVPSSLVAVPTHSYLSHCIHLCVHFLWLSSVKYYTMLRADFIKRVLYTSIKLYKMGNFLSTPVSHCLSYLFFSFSCQSSLKSAPLQPDMKVLIRKDLNRQGYPPPHNLSWRNLSPYASWINKKVGFGCS